MNEHRAIIDGKLYERSFDWSPLVAVSAEDLTARVLNFEKLLAERDATIAELQAEVERLQKKCIDQAIAYTDVHEQLSAVERERDRLKSCEVIMRKALIKIASYTQSDGLLWWQLEARDVLNKCSTSNPEFQPLDEEGQPLPTGDSHG